MDEAIAERVRARVRESLEPQDGTSQPKRFHLDGLVLILPNMDARACASARATYAAKADVLRLTDKATAEVFEMMAEFWKTAAAMLKAAEVTTLGELLED